MIIPSFKGSDTVIAFTNEQVIKFNQEHVVLKQCIEYSDIQDSIIAHKQLEIKKLEQIRNTAMKNDSISRRVIQIQNDLVYLKNKENEELKNTFIQFQRQTRREKIKSLFTSTFVVTPLAIAIGFLSGFFTK